MPSDYEVIQDLPMSLAGRFGITGLIFLGVTFILFIHKSFHQCSDYPHNVNYQCLCCQRTEKAIWGFAGLTVTSWLTAVWV
jgi:hypothetical protein